MSHFLCPFGEAGGNEQEGCSVASVQRSEACGSVYQHFTLYSMKY